MYILKVETSGTVLCAVRLLLVSALLALNRNLSYIRPTEHVQDKTDIQNSYLHLIKNIPLQHVQMVPSHTKQNNKSRKYSCDQYEF